LCLPESIKGKAQITGQCSLKQQLPSFISNILASSASALQPGHFVTQIDTWLNLQHSLDQLFGLRSIKNMGLTCIGLQTIF
jgi:hypothetical protein